MPLSDETKEKLKSYFAKPFVQLPVAKDLPRLAKYVNFCDEDGVVLPYVEAGTLDFEKFQSNEEKNLNFKLFFHVRRVLLTLMLRLEGQQACLELDVALLQQIDDENFFLPEVMTKFLEVHCGGEDGRVVKVLKCVNQAIIAPALIEMKMAMGVENTTKDVAYTWRVAVIFTTDRVRIVHNKREQCITKRFELEWELNVSLLIDSDQMDETLFKIVDLCFNNDLINSKQQITDIKNCLKNYMSNDLWNHLNAKTFTFFPDGKVSQKIPSEFSLLQGEKVIGIYNATYIHQISGIISDGVIYLSNYQLFFLSEREGTKNYFHVPLRIIAKFCKKEKKELEIVCHDIRILRFVFQGKDCKLFSKNLKQCIPQHFNQLFALTHARALIVSQLEEEQTAINILSNGWRLFNFEEEIERMNIGFHLWRISTINQHFQLCESYPRLMVVPQSISDHQLLQSSKYRSRGRIPVLTWKHRNNSSLSHGTLPSIHVSQDSAKSIRQEDDKLLSAFAKNSAEHHSNSQASSPTKATRTSKLHRPRTLSEKGSAKSRIKNIIGTLNSGTLRSKDNQIPGIDIEDFFYIELFQRGDSSKLQSINTNFTPPTGVSVGRDNVIIENLQELKESYRKLQKLCNSNQFQLQLLTNSSDTVPAGTSMNEYENWLTLLDNTRWFDQLHTLMACSSRLVDIIGRGSSVFLCYSDDGWDRGCQVSSLAQLWMDPYYRTIKGFITLIEKEWLMFGHPFSDRCGHFLNDDHPDIVPVFIQFIDCVWQTLYQFPSHFEFNSKFLVDICQNVYSCLFGTFILNNDKERRVYRSRFLTESFWTNSIANSNYKNNSYVGELEATLVPSFNPRALTLWSSFYLRWFEHKYPMELPNQGDSTTGQDILSSLVNLNLIESKEKEASLAKEIAALQQTAKLMETEINYQKEILSLLKKGNTLQMAQRELLIKSHQESLEADKLGTSRNKENPTSADPAAVLLRGSRIEKIKRRKKRNVHSCRTSKINPHDSEPDRRRLTEKEGLVLNFPHHRLSENDSAPEPIYCPISDRPRTLTQHSEKPAIAISRKQPKANIKRNTSWDTLPSQKMTTFQTIG